MTCMMWSHGAQLRAFQELIRASSSVMPGVIECEESVEVVQRAVGELTGMALAVAVGNFDAKAAEGLTHQVFLLFAYTYPILMVT